MKKVETAAIRTATGGIHRATHHADLEAKGIKGKKGFTLSDGQFADRTTAAKVAKAAGQVPKGIRSLHSEHLTEYAAKKKRTGSI